VLVRRPISVSKPKRAQPDHHLRKVNKIKGKEILISIEWDETEKKLLKRKAGLMLVYEKKEKKFKKC